MAPIATEFVSKTQLYLKVKKPLLERQRRARFNQCLDSLKTLVAEFQGDDAILRMDKAEMLESAIAFVRTRTLAARNSTTSASATASRSGAAAAAAPMESFRHGYMNAVNEVSRVMAATPGMSVHVGKAVMTHLGCEFNRLLHCDATTAHNPPKQQQKVQQQQQEQKQSAPMSPASSGYHSDGESDSDESAPATPTEQSVWRPW